MKARTALEGPRRYEAMFLVDSGLAAKEWDTVEATLKGFFEKHGARVLSAGKWDERRLAFPIKGFKRATYWLAYVEAPTSAVDDIRRDATLSETVLRCMVLSLDNSEEIPEDVSTRRSTVALGDDSDNR